MDNVEKFEKKDYPLHTVLIKEWEGFIFICLSDKAEEFDTFYEPIKINLMSGNFLNLKQ